MEELNALLEFKKNLLDLVQEVTDKIDEHQLFTTKIMKSFGFSLKRESTFLKEYVMTNASMPEWSVVALINQYCPNKITIQQNYKEESNKFEFYLESVDELERLLEQLYLL